MKHPEQIAMLVFLLCGVVFAWRIGKILFFILKATKDRGEGFSWDNLLLFFMKKIKRSSATFAQKAVVAILHTVLMLALVMMIISVLFPRNETVHSITFWVAWGAIVCGVIFISRRAVLRIKRLNSADLSSKNKIDGYTVLILELASAGTFIAVDWAGEWMNVAHYTVMGVFLVYLTYSKHLHIFFAIPYMIYSAGKSDTLSAIRIISAEFTGEAATNEKLGADRAEDMSRGDILGAFSCTECGRCLEVCPSAIVGGDISPRKVVIELRRACQSTDSTLYPTRITNSELYSCVSCGACVETCPIGIDPLRVILKMRRFAALEEGSLPAEYSTAAANTTATQNPWGIKSKSHEYER